MNRPFNLLISILVVLQFVGYYNSLPGQVLCIDCFHQNERVLSNKPNLLLNGGFEFGCASYALICPNSIDYECDVFNWVCTGGGSETYAIIISTIDMSLVVEGERAIYFGNAFCDVCPLSQDTTCFYQSGCEVFGIPEGFPRNDEEYGGQEGISLEQTVGGLIPGDYYEIEFWAGGEEFGNSFLVSGLFAVDIGYGKIFLRNPTTPAKDGEGIRYIIYFRAISDYAKIKFTNWGHMLVDATELIIDDVRLMKSDESVIPCSTSILEPNFDQFITINPNPFNMTANIVLNFPEFRDVSLKIYDVNGIFLRRIDIVQKTTKFERKTLSNGLYYFELLFKNKNLQTGKFIIN